MQSFFFSILAYKVWLVLSLRNSNAIFNFYMVGDLLCFKEILNLFPFLGKVCELEDPPEKLRRGK
jgi:hypothetical protein